MKIDLSYERFGRLFVLPKWERRKGSVVFWLCRCSCGEYVWRRAGDLRRGLRKREVSSCGCVHREQIATLNRSHGQAHTVEYAAWKSMKDRTTNRRSPVYYRYGGRGITVCRRWEDSFENFLADLGPKPEPELTLERIDNDLGYSPENCKWATRSEQNRNKRKAA